MEYTIYFAPRDQSFKTLISDILKEGDVSKHYREQLLTDEAMTYFATAFTHPSADLNANYDFFETLGDNTLNKCVVWYLPRRFPQINCPQGKDILTKLKITIIQTKGFGEIADKLGFWDFISCDKDIRKSQVFRMKILEDCLEAFFGALEWFLDDKFKIGVGYSVCYKIVSKLLDAKEISLKYTDLYDNKTILKELFDKISLRGHGEISYDSKQVGMIGTDKLYHSSAIQTYPNGQKRVIGQGKNVNKAEAEKMAAKEALEKLASEGLSKPIPKEFLKFCV
jgi:dsRNA-specific ribonuclease